MDIKELNVIYETWFGSHAYGTSRPDSDEDFRGIAIAPLPYYLGCLQKFEQKEEKVPDRVLWDIKKFCMMGLNANPSSYEILYCENSDIITMTDSGKLLRDNRDLFLSSKIGDSYLDYGFSQLRRIRRHRQWLLNPPGAKPERATYGLPDQHKLVTRDHMGAFLYVLNHILKGSIEEAKLSEPVLEEIRNINTVGLLQSFDPKDERVWSEIQQLSGCTDNFIEAMSKEKQYQKAMEGWTSYQSWKKNRNPKRAVLEAKYGFDLKHAVNLVRLIRMGEEILTGKGIIVRRPDAEELKAIGKGAWTFEQLEEWAQEKEKLFKILKKTTKLPRNPNRKRVNELCQEIMSRELYPDIVIANMDWDEE